MQAFESEHKVGIYFFRTAMLLDQKWGTSSSIKYEDPKYGFPVGLRAYGNYSYKITNPEHFFVSVVGAQDIFTSDEFREIMTSRIVHPLTDYLAEEKLSYIDIDAKREEISIALLDRLNKEFIQLGFHLNDFRIEGTGFDEGTKERISRIADIAADSHAAKAAGVSYQELQKLQAMREAANNEVGAAGVFMGLGAGNMLSQTMNESITSQQVDSNDFTLKLRQLKSLFEEGLINEEEYSAKKADILKEL